MGITGATGRWTGNRREGCIKLSSDAEASKGVSRVLKVLSWNTMTVLSTMTVLNMMMVLSTMTVLGVLSNAPSSPPVKHAVAVPRCKAHTTIPKYCRYPH